MARLNLKPRFTETTHEGAPAARMNAEQALRRSVLSCLLWESEFYEDGEDIAKRIVDLVAEVPAEKVATLTIEARQQFNLRHVPLLLLSAAARHKKLKASTVAATIQRADELTELLAIHAKLNGVEVSKIKPIIPSQMKRGLAQAFTKFDEYQLSKYDRAGAVRLRDVLFLCHAKPETDEQAALWKRLVGNELKVPDTWEVALSGGADKKEAFTRLLAEGKLGYMALLRNLRNMESAGVESSVINEAILVRKGGAHRVLPFRFLSAAKAAPKFEESLDAAMVANLAQSPKLPGKTVIIVDVSGSMHAMLSAKGDMNRAKAACALAAIGRELCEESAIYATAGNDFARTHATALVPSRHGMALIDAIWNMSGPLGGGGIFLKQVMDYVAAQEKSADRVIVITDEQDCDNTSNGAPAQAKLFAPANYMCNVSGHKNGIGYGRWVHIDGFSEQVLRFISEYEAEGTR